jgi:hypothetical protein
MSSNNGDHMKQDEDNRAVWERPAFRRLVTEYAESTGVFQSEGQPPGGGMDCQSGDKSCKGLLP